MSLSCRRNQWFAIALFFPLCWAHITIHGPTSTFRDEFNRTRLWRGTNFVEKSAPYYPQDLDATTIATMLEMGMNVVRLGVMAGGTFPDSSANLNSTYLDQIEAIIDTLWRSSIWTIVDFHQDVLSPVICGEGLPSWMVNVSELDSMPFPMPIVRNGSQPDPSTGGWVDPIDCSPVGPLESIGWSEFYATDACGKAFQQVFDGTGTAGHMVQQHWSAVAAHLQAHPGVLSYEMMNEPWQGDWISNPELMVRAGVAEKESVGPYMEMTHSTIRAVDPDTLTMYAPAELNNRLMRPVGYEYPFLAGEPMAFHVYCLTGTDGDGPVTPQQVALCHANDGFTLKQRESDLRRLQTAGFVTEFGAVSDTSTGLAEVRFVADAMDEVFPPLSWAFWDKIPSADDYRTELARPYPVAVAGDITGFSFNISRGLFQLSFAPHPPLEGAATEIYLGAYQYPDGWKASLSPPDCCDLQETSTSITLSVLAETYSPQSEISVVIEPN